MPRMNCRLATALNAHWFVVPPVVFVALAIQTLAEPARCEETTKLRTVRVTAVERTGGPRAPRSKDNLLDDAAVDVGQPEVAPAVTVCQFFVIKAQQMQDRCV